MHTFEILCDFLLLFKSFMCIFSYAHKATLGQYIGPKWDFISAVYKWVHNFFVLGAIKL